MKRLVFISLSLLLLLIPGCFTFQTTAPNPIPPVIKEFSSTPSGVNSGSPSTLFWNVTGATSVNIDQGIGRVDFVGIKVVSPATSTVYTISATNSAGTTVTGSAVITVNSAPIPAVHIPLSGITVGVMPGESGSIVKGR